MATGTEDPNSSNGHHVLRQHDDDDMADLQDVPAPPKKRRRIVISCTECHRRKQKCDRGLPCGNCKSRNKESSCRYETGAPTAKEQGKTSIYNGYSGSSNDIDNNIIGGGGGGGAVNAMPGHEYNGPTLPPLQSLSGAAADWGYSQSTGSTLGFLRKIESANGDAGLSASVPAAADDVLITKERYKALIRQLPAKSYIEKLIHVYLKEFNHLYYPLDEDVFLRQWADWNNVSFNVLNLSGPQGLSPDLRMFPALLFQVLGTALLTLAEEPHEFFDHLKYAGNMTFEDLASDYSESGLAILNLLGKRHLTLVAVQASFLRANFLKHMGKVAESWHAIGSAIKDAQEIGMHRDNLDPQPASDSLEDVLENQWLVQSRRRLYCVLIMWDLHCGVVLGRPGTIDWRAPRPSLPIDSPVPKDRRRTPIRTRDEDRDPPTPITKQIASFKLMSPLVHVVEMEQDGTCPKSYDKVDRAHELSEQLAEEIPACFRLVNPDRRWDDHPDCWWLPTCRGYLQQLHHFNFIALHRPYIYNRQESRTVALRESIDSLQAQMDAFQGMDPKSWRNFQLFFGSFDAVVLVASIYILFPKENADLAPKALQEFQWTMERFEAMSNRNRLAKSARGVLQAIYAKLKRVVSNQVQTARSVSTIAHTPSSTTESMASSRDSMATGATSVDTPIRQGSGESPVVSTTAMLKAETPGQMAPSVSSYPPPPGPDWAMPNNFDFTNIAPLFPISDILYNDVGIPGDGSYPTWTTAAAAPPPAPAALANNNGGPDIFEGDFGGDSFWSLMNQYEPAPM